MKKIFVSVSLAVWWILILVWLLFGSPFYKVIAVIAIVVDMIFHLSMKAVDIIWAMVHK